jgi:hypothetical protein
MSAAVRLGRKNSLQLLREAAKLGPYDEFPVLRPEIDPQVHASRNDHAQPFYLVFEKDSVLVQFTGQGQVRMRGSSVNSYDLEPGDFVYIPGGVPHRVMVDQPVVQYRYKARDPGLEAVIIPCERCDAELFYLEWDGAAEPAQAGYLRAVKAFNASAQAQTCGRCGEVHPLIDLQRYRWGAIAHFLSSPEESSAEAG